jgi:DNA ligase (NAD+)
MDSHLVNVSIIEHILQILTDDGEISEISFNKTSGKFSLALNTSGHIDTFSDLDLTGLLLYLNQHKIGESFSFDKDELETLRKAIAEFAPEPLISPPHIEKTKKEESEETILIERSITEPKEPTWLLFDNRILARVLGITDVLDLPSDIKQNYLEKGWEKIYHIELENKKVTETEKRTGDALQSKLFKDHRIWHVWYVGGGIKHRTTHHDFTDEQIQFLNQASYLKYKETPLKHKPKPAPSEEAQLEEELLQATIEATKEPSAKLETKPAPIIMISEPKPETPIEKPISAKKSKPKKETSTESISSKELTVQLVQILNSYDEMDFQFIVGPYLAKELHYDVDFDLHSKEQYLAFVNDSQYAIYHSFLLLALQSDKLQTQFKRESKEVEIKSPKKALEPKEVETKSEEIQNLEREIKYHQELYYNGTPEITDAEFDALWDRLKKIDPTNRLFSCIGTDKVCYFQKYKHIIPMGSQEKATTPEEFELWTKKVNYDEYLAEFKYDGISLESQYANGTFLRAVTRGDGKQGDVITPNVKKMKGFVNLIDKDFSGAIRFEILMSHKIFNSKYSDQANCRGMASGISKRQSGEGSEDLMIIAYDALSTSQKIFWKTETEKIQWLKQQGFDVVEIVRFTHVQDIIDYRDKIAKTRLETLDFDIDGLVIKGDEIDLEDMKRDRPIKQVAFKFAVTETISILKGIEWSESGQFYTPVALIQPVEIDGTMVKRASLSNPNLIKTLNLKIGDHVIVSKHGEIIPMIDKVVYSPPDTIPIQIPEICNTCGTKLINAGTHLFCPNTECDKRKIHRLAKWIAELGIRDIGESMLGKLFENKLVLKPADFYTLTAQQLKTLANVGDTMANKLVKNILEKSEISLAKFIAGFDIEGVGERNVQKVVTAGLDTLELIYNTSISELSKSGIGEITAEKLYHGMQENYDDMLNVLKTGKLTIKKPFIAHGGKLNGKSFCFTGALQTMKRTEAQALVIQHGGTVKEGVGKGLTYLVTNDQTSNSAKMQKAVQIGIQIISENDFLDMLK